MNPAPDPSAENCRLIQTNIPELISRAYDSIIQLQRVSEPIASAIIQSLLSDRMLVATDPRICNVINIAPDLFAQSFINFAARSLRQDPPDTAGATRCLVFAGYACAWNISLSPGHRRVIRDEIAPLIRSLDGNDRNSHEILSHIQPA